MNDHLAKPVTPTTPVPGPGALVAGRQPPARPLRSKPRRPPGRPEPGSPPAIAGLDTTEGLRSTRGQLPRYLRLLDRFACSYQGSATGLRAQLAEGRLDEIRLLAEGLPEQRGPLGASQLAACAAQLEQSLQHPAPDHTLNTQVEALAGESWNASLAAITTATGPLGPSPAALRDFIAELGTPRGQRRPRRLGVARQGTLAGEHLRPDRPADQHRHRTLRIRGSRGTADDHRGRTSGARQSGRGLRGPAPRGLSPAASIMAGSSGRPAAGNQAAA